MFLLWTQWQHLILCDIVSRNVIEARYVPSRWLRHGDYKPRWPPRPRLQLPGSSGVGTQLLWVKEKSC